MTPARRKRSDPSLLVRRRAQRSRGAAAATTWACCCPEAQVCGETRASSRAEAHTAEHAAAGGGTDTTPQQAGAETSCATAPSGWKAACARSSAQEERSAQNAGSEAPRA